MRKFRQKLTASAITLIFLTPSFTSVNAANHPYSQINASRTVAGVKVTDIEFTVNLDWDPASPPPAVTGVDKDGKPTTLVLNEAYVKSVLDTVASTLFKMTQGKHRISTFYVYKNGQYGNNVDIRIINKEGRSNANVSGFNRNGFTSNNFIIQGKSGDINILETETDLGRVIAHELGHYFYGLYDEYREPGGKSTEPSSPRDEDTAKDTLMHDQYRFSTLSTAGEYADAAARKTAQARVYGKADGTGGSAWEVLTRPKSQDTGVALEDDGAQNRLEFDAFLGGNFPTQASLSQPTLPIPDLPTITYLTPSAMKNILLIDTSAPTAQLEKIIEAAIGVIGKSPRDGSTGIYRTSQSGSTFEVQALTLNDSTGRQGLVAKLNALKTAGTSGTASGDSLVAALTALGDRGDASLNSSANVTLLVSDSVSITEAVAKTARDRKIALNVVRFTGPATTDRNAAALAKTATQNFEMIAKVSGGAYNSARSGAEAAKEATRELMSGEQNLVLIDSDGTDPLAANQKLTSTFRIAKDSVDGVVVANWYFDPADASKLTFSLKTPGGTTITNTALGGTTFTLSAEEGYAEFEIPKSLVGREGVWTAEVAASTGTTDSIEFEALSESMSAIKVEFLSANATMGPKLTATFLGNGYPISGATVTATIFNGDTGNVVRENVVLRDNGLGADNKPGDGVYTADLTGLLPAGNYFADVVAATTATSTFSTNVIFARGAPPAAELTGLLTRTDLSEFQMTPTDASFRAPVASTSSGGGCSAIAGGNDASLLLLLAAAGAGGLLRARRRNRLQRTTQA